MAGAGAAALWAGRGGRTRLVERATGAALLAAIGVGVLWSGALAYRDVNLAPRDQLAELETIGHRIAGQGPTLMTEYQPYGVRHFLRDADPEGASELRRRQVPLRGGGTLHKGSHRRHRSLPARRPTGLPDPRAAPLAHPESPSVALPADLARPLLRGLAATRGSGVIGDRPSRARLHEGPDGNARVLGRASSSPARRAPSGPSSRPGARRSRPSRCSAPRTRAPGTGPDYPRTLLPVTAGTIRSRVRVPHSGRYEVWLGGSVRPQVDLSVDGREVGQVRHQLNNEGEYVLLGKARLDVGRSRAR